MSKCEMNHVGDGTKSSPAEHSSTPMVDMADPKLMSSVFKQAFKSNISNSETGDIIFDSPFKNLEAWEKGKFKNGTLSISETISPDNFSLNISFKPTAGDMPAPKPVEPAPKPAEPAPKPVEPAPKPVEHTVTPPVQDGTHPVGKTSRLAGYAVHFGQYGSGYGDPIATVDKLAKDGVNMIRDDYSHNNKAEEQAVVRAVQDGMHPLLIVQNVQAMKNAIDEYKNLKTADGKSVLANTNFEYRNEPDPRTTNPATYAAEATQADKMLKAVSPTSQFIIGAQAYGGTIQGANNFIEKVAKDMNYQNFDAVSIHPYGDAWHMTPKTIASKIEDFEKQIASQAGHQITVDVSENGWTHAEDPNGAQAAELINLLAKDPYIGMYGAYELNKDGVDKGKWAIAGTNAYKPITNAEADFINT